MKEFYFTYRDGEWEARVVAETLEDAKELLHRALSIRQPMANVEFFPVNTHDEMWKEMGE